MLRCYDALQALRGIALVSAVTIVASGCHSAAPLLDVSSDSGAAIHEKLRNLN
jgi:hypothetical protein